MNTSTLRFYGSTESWEAIVSFERTADASAFAAQFPKAAGITVHGANVSARAILRGDGVNGGVNEAGLRRYRALVASAEKLGVPMAWGTTGAGFRRVDLTQADFEQTILAEP
ncbi:hypothetical protein [Rhodococcus sp. BS-15]|uniref:hypothetical protein n=1 Tax=Rhodococcus sp. BS-15 TaxID=1304954 RepID=UPI000A65D51C|nr:hypothetical protein [Rhodococcus sp. BS-15]